MPEFVPLPKPEQIQSIEAAHGLPILELNGLPPNDFYEAMIKQFPDHMVSITEAPYEDYNQFAVYVGDSLVEKLGFNQDHWNTNEHLWESLLHQDDKERVLKEFEESHETGKFNSEYRLIAADGSDLWIRDEAKIFKDESGQHIFVSKMRDITSEKESELRARKEADELAAIVRALGEINSAVSINDILTHIVKYMGEFISYDTANIMFLVDDKDGKKVQMKYRWSGAGHDAEMDESLVGESKSLEKYPVMMSIIASGKSTMVPEVDWDSDTKSYIGIPIKDHEGKIVAIMNINRKREGPFTQEDLHRCESFARLTGAALHDRRMHEEVEKLSLTDDRTGLHNDRYYEVIIRREIAKALRYPEQHDLSLIFFDNDQFSAYNDIEGYDVGHKILRDSAQKAKEKIRSTDDIVRYGGEEYIVVVPDTFQNAITVADKIYKGYGELSPHIVQKGGTSEKHRVTWVQGQEVRITASFGVASIKEISQPLANLSLEEKIDYYEEALRKLAEKRMKLAKQSGRNRIVSTDSIE